MSPGPGYTLTAKSPALLAESKILRPAPLRSHARKSRKCREKSLPHRSPPASIPYHPDGKQVPAGEPPPNTIENGIRSQTQSPY